MSASTVSITANPAAAARRRPVLSGEKKSNLDFLINEAQVSGTIGESAGTTRDLIRGGDVVADKSSSDLAPVVKKAVSAVTTPATTQRRTRKAAAPPMPEKPRWKRVGKIFMKNFFALMLMVGIIHLVRKVVMESAKSPASPSSSLETEMVFSALEERIAEVDGFVKTTAKMMQVQVELLDKKIDGETRGLRETIDDSVKSFETGIRVVESKTEKLEKSLNKLTSQNWASKEELERIYEDLKKGKDDESADTDVNVDELRAFARDIVEKEIEKHAADGLGRVDYALASGGAFVVKHSEPYLTGKGGNWFNMNSKNQVHEKAAKMLSPSFGEPGQCFPLKGSNGYVQIRLRTAIVPEAITLEHVSKTVAYDRSSAPKDCRVSGWLQRQGIDSPIETEKIYFLKEFTYDLDKTNAQTYDITDSASSGLLVDTVRLDFTSNHGSPSHTCIYRFRVHGHEPDPVSMVAKQP